MKFADANTESCMQPQVINFELRACSKTIVACFAGSDLCLAFQIVLQTRPFNLLVEGPIIFLVPMKVKKKLVLFTYETVDTSSTTLNMHLNHVPHFYL